MCSHVAGYLCQQIDENICIILEYIDIHVMQSRHSSHSRLCVPLHSDIF